MNPPKSNPPSKEQISLWVIEDNARLRHYLAKYLNEFKDLQCTGIFSNCEDALAEMENRQPPRILLIDLDLPGMNGISGISEFKQRCPGIEALVLTVSQDRENVFEAITAGASGYLLKNASIETIAEGCRKLAKGETSLDGTIARMMLGFFQKAKPTPAEHNLTSRELEILQLLAAGLFCKEIADKLNVSSSTVNFHCSNLFKKLHVQSQRSAIHEAKRRGILAN
jgi:DNA-binding NarL/FixJ family response regulator